MDMAGSPWFVSGMRAPPAAKPKVKVGQVIGGKMKPRGRKERTGRQTGFSGRFETEELGNRRPEDVKVKHADACAVVRGEGKGEVHLGERGESVSLQVGISHTRDMISREGEPATVLFPTPPLPLATATTFFTFGMPRFGGRPRRGIIGGSPRFGSP